MAKSQGYYGLRRGSTKSHTYSVVGGKQITKDRQTGGKNPRTMNQMIQRCLISTISQAYRAMKIVVDHSFEGVTAGADSMHKFFSENLKRIRYAQQDGNQSFGFNPYQQAGMKAGSFVVSMGSLDDCAVDSEIASITAGSKLINIDCVPGTAASTIADIVAALGLRQFGDNAAFCFMFPKADGNYGFGAVKLTYKAGSSIAESFDVAFAGEVKSATLSWSTNTLKLAITTNNEFANGATAAKCAMVAIASQQVNGEWRRSNAQFDITDATPTFANAIATYPVGQERFLNGEGETASAGVSTGGSTGGNTGGNTGGGTTPPAGGDDGDNEG